MSRGAADLCYIAPGLSVMSVPCGSTFWAFYKLLPTMCRGLISGVVLPGIRRSGS